jgi:hypothetical protein
VAGRKGRRALEDNVSEHYEELDVQRDLVRGKDSVRFAEVLVAIGGSLAARTLLGSGDDGQVAIDVSENLASSAAFEWALQNCGDGAPEWDSDNMLPEKAIQAALVRDIFGNPFRPLTLDAAHRTPVVVSVARAAYDEGHLPSGELDPHRLTVLADALEEAGAPAELVKHLRSPGPHVRGCHVVDLCLGLS